MEIEDEGAIKDIIFPPDPKINRKEVIRLQPEDFSVACLKFEIYFICEIESSVSVKNHVFSF